MIARNQKHRRVLLAAPLERSRQALPEIQSRIGIIEDIPNTKDRVYRIPARHVEDSPHHIHAGAGELLLPFFRERRKAPAQMPIGSVQKP